MHMFPFKMYFFSHKIHIFVNEAGKVDEKEMCLITAHSSTKILSLRVAYIAILGLSYSYVWIRIVFMLYVLGDFVPSNLFVFVIFHLLFFKLTWLYSVSMTV